jgi:pyrimidine-nucleoside phosphorylase
VEVLVSADVTPDQGNHPEGMAMNAVELIRKKRDGGILARKELEYFVTGFVNGEIPDYQMSAFLMAAFLKGMGPEESSIFTDIMLRSGTIVDLSTIPGKKVDKHSTGGVGDKVSLILAPMVASCGVVVPMISGRALGHTGGTVDKLESIPGFRTDLGVEEYRSIVEEIGLVLSGQTSDIAPADKRMYALRDVTATVESIPLIAGSIMSKKLAEGIDALVLDVKTGNGAFMQTYDEAVALAHALVEIGKRAGKELLGFITDMNQPLGLAIGNWLEVAECIDCLRGKNVPDLMEVTFVLGGAMVFLGGKASTIAEGITLCRSAIWSGKAYEKFIAVVERQGGDASCIREPVRYPRARYCTEVYARTAGYITSLSTREIGVLAGELGAGRVHLEDPIDPKAGIIISKKLGDRVEKDDLLALLYTDKPAMAEVAEARYASLVTIGPEPVPRQPVVLAMVDGAGVQPWKTPETY